MLRQYVNWQVSKAATLSSLIARVRSLSRTRLASLHAILSLLTFTYEGKLADRQGY